MKKRLFTILISLMMVLTMMPFMAVVSNADTAPEPLCFTAEATNSSVEFSRGPRQNPSLLYSIDGTEWSTYTSNTEIKLPNVGDKVYFKADNPNDCFSGSSFYMTGTIAASGNIMSLLNSSESLMSIPSDKCFSALFSFCRQLVSTPELPATTLTPKCYQHMFYGCENLIKAPDLAAENLKESCYLAMFYGCSSLTVAPRLPAKKLAPNCYEMMFMNCTSLNTPPLLPATELASSCYLRMFSGCTNLTKLPELPATELPDLCYTNMFDECTQFVLYEKVNQSGFTTFRIPSSNKDITYMGFVPLEKMVNGKTLQPGVTYYYNISHDSVEKRSGKEATCTESGYKEYYECTDCGMLFTDADAKNPIYDFEEWVKGEGKISIKPHSIKKVKGNYVCNGIGWKDYYKCTACNKRFSDKDGKHEITDFAAWKIGDGKLVNPGHVVSEWFASKSYHFGECKYCGTAVTADHNGSPCGVCGYVASEVQEPEDDEEYIHDEEEVIDDEEIVEGEEGENPKEVSSIFSNGTTWIVLVIGLAAIAGVAVLAIKKRK